MICPRADTRAELLLFPSQVLTRSGSADPELTVSARARALGTPTRKTPYCSHVEQYRVEPLLLKGLM